MDVEQHNPPVPADDSRRDQDQPASVRVHGEVCKITENGRATATEAARGYGRTDPVRGVLP